MKLSEISSTLREIRVAPVKTLGQNFLHDANLARWIVAQLDPMPGDFVVEIGPGLGALTENILSTGASVLALEKDARLVSFLRERWPNAALEILHGDALDFDPRTLFPRQPVKLIGNLPYYVSSQLLMHFTAQPSCISLAVFMLQKEMARRISAAPGSKDFGSLTLFVQLHYRVEFLRTVPATVFVPEPEVDSALVRLTPRPPGDLPDCDSVRFEKLVRLGFSQRRKQLRKLLGHEVQNFEEVAERGGFSPQARAEELSLEQWIALANVSSDPDGASGKTDPAEAFAVIDADDRFVRLAPRSEVHGDNLRHRAVHILLFNRANELFLQKRSRHKDRHPGKWDSSAAGHLAGEEPYGEGAHRELLEELGVDTPLEPTAKLPPSEATGHEFIQVYRGLHDGPFALAPSEIETGGFFPRAIVDEWIAARPQDFATGFLECWRAESAAD